MGDGSRDLPFATLTHGLVAAAAQQKRVYACADVYPETLVIDVALDGSELYGRFDCATWSYSSSRRAELSSPGTIALTVTRLINGLHIENFSLTAADATTAGGSSVGVLVRDSQQVSLRRVEITAGANAAAGAQFHQS